MPKTCGVDHVGLTVSDVIASRDFFVECFGWRQVGEKPEYPAVFVSDGQVTITLWQARNSDAFNEFNRHTNVGLHHLALRVENLDSLIELFERASRWPGVKVEFGPEKMGPGPKRHAMFYEPGGVRIELDFAPPANY
ncbi:VOC family protein [Paraburkholderia sp. 22B1P]|nr:VOC family protein [Paraburkholderia sp. 22B1P]